MSQMRTVIQNKQTKTALKYKKEVSKMYSRFRQGAQEECNHCIMDRTQA